MKIEQRTVYIAGDGQEFDDEITCLIYDRKKKLTDYILATADEFDAEEVAYFIFDRFDTIKGILEGSYD